MTDETSSTTAVADAPDAPAESEHSAVEHAPAAAVPYWQRPAVERYVMPLITPILVVIGLVIFVLNVSRVFLSAHGDTAVIVGSILTVVILLGATVLSNSPRLRSSSISFMTVGFLLVVCTSGWLVLGHSAQKGEATEPIPVSGPVSGSIKISALASIKFTPVSLTQKTGIYEISLVNDAAAPHTLDFDDAATRFGGLAVNSAGETQKARIFFGEAGDYTFFCAVPGHRGAGMQGVVHVTGPSMTLEEALAAGKTPA